MSSGEIINLVDALFETDLHKLRRSFENEDSRGVSRLAFVWILATTVPAFKTVISTFPEKFESDYRRRRRAMAENVISLDAAPNSRPNSANNNNDNNLHGKIFVKPSTEITPQGIVVEQRKVVVNIANLISGTGHNSYNISFNPSVAPDNSESANQHQQNNNNKIKNSALPYLYTDPTAMSWTEREQELGKRLRSNLESLFVAMDVDGDNCVEWEEFYSYTVSTTMHKLTVKPADVVRLYGVSKQIARQDNVVCVRDFHQMNAIGISSRHEGLELLDNTTLRVVARSSRLSLFDGEALIKSSSLASFDQMNQEETAGSMDSNSNNNNNSEGGSGLNNAMAGTSAGSSHHSMTASPTVTNMCFVNSPGVVVAAADNLRLYCYSVLNGGDAAAIVKGKKIPGTQFRLSPICSEPVPHRITQLRTADSAPQLAFASSSAGDLSCYEIFDVHRPRLRYKFPLHSPGTIISDFCFMSPTDHKVISTAFDRTVRVTDLHLLGEGHTESFWVVGEPDHACTHLSYSEQHELIVTASVDRQVRAWTCHSTRRPATLLFDSSNPHQEKIVGLFQIKGTPQLVSCDEGGLVKVWDLRNFRCAQSFVVGSNQTEVVDEAEVHATGGVSRSSMAAILGEQQLRRNIALNDICYVEGKESFCCVGPSKVSLHKYDAGANPNVATESFVVSVQFLADQNSVVMATPQELVAWDVATGSITATVSEPTWAQDDFSCLVCDHSDRRVIAGTRSGKILMWSAVGLNRIQSQIIKPHHGFSSSSTTTAKNNNSNRKKSTSPSKHNHNNNGTNKNEKHDASSVAVGVTGVGFCAAQNTIISIGTDGFMQVQRLEANVSNLTSNRYLLGTGIPLYALSVSDACATVACGDDTGNLFVMDPLVVSGQPLLFRTTLSASISCTVFCGNFPMVVAATVDGWFSLFTCRPAPDGILLAKWRCDGNNNNINNSNEFCASSSPSPSFVSRTVRQGMAAVSGFDAFLEKNRSILNPENDFIHATCLAFDPVSHKLFAGTNTGEVFIWSLCEVIAHYRPSLVSTSFVSLGEFLNYKWDQSEEHKNKMTSPRSKTPTTTRKMKSRRQTSDSSLQQQHQLPVPVLLLKKEIHYNSSNHEDDDNNNDTELQKRKVSKKQPKCKHLTQQQQDAGSILSIDVTSLSDGSIVVVTAGESDRRCCISKFMTRKSINSNDQSEEVFFVEEAGDLSYGRPSSISGDTYVGGEKISDYQWDENVACVKIHELGSKAFAPGKTCSHVTIPLPSPSPRSETDGKNDDSDEWSSDSDDYEIDQEGNRIKLKQQNRVHERNGNGVFGDLIVKTRKYYDKNTESDNSKRQKLFEPSSKADNATDDEDNTEGNQKSNISGYRIMHPDPVRTLAEEEEIKRRLASETRLQSAIRKATSTSESSSSLHQKNRAPPRDQIIGGDEGDSRNASPRNHQQQFPRPPKFVSRVGVSSAPGSARRHRTSEFNEVNDHQLIEHQIQHQHNQQGAETKKSSRPSSSSTANNKKIHGNHHDEEDHVSNAEDVDGDIISADDQQLLQDQKLNYEHRLREMSRQSKLSDHQILKMNLRGVEELERHAKEMLEREAQLEKEQAEKNLRDAEAASVAATIATTRDLTREDKDVAPSLPTDLSLVTLLTAAAVEQRRLASSARLPPLFLGTQKEEFAKATMKTQSARKLSASSLNPLDGIVCGDAMMCGIAHRPRAGSQVRPATSGSSSSSSTFQNKKFNVGMSLTASVDQQERRLRLYNPRNEFEVPTIPKNAGLCVGTNVVRPPTASRNIHRSSVVNGSASRPSSSSSSFAQKHRRCVSPPQSAGVASIARNGAASTTALRNLNATTAGKPRKLTLSEQRDQKIQNYSKRLKECLKWGGGIAGGIPMDRDQLRKDALLQYNLELVDASKKSRSKTVDNNNESGDDEN